MTAVECMKKELRRIQRLISECVDECGVEYPWKKYQHQTLIRKANEFKASIEWMENNVYSRCN